MNSAVITVQNPNSMQLFLAHRRNNILKKLKANYFSDIVVWYYYYFVQVLLIVTLRNKRLMFHLGRPYRMRIAVTSHRLVSLYGSVIISMILFPAILGLLSIWKIFPFRTQQNNRSRVEHDLNEEKIILLVFGTTLTVLTVCSSDKHSPLVSGRWWWP